MPSFLGEVLTSHEIAELGLTTAAAEEEFRPDKVLPWRSFKLTRAWLTIWAVTELFIEYHFAIGCYEQWQRIPWLMSWPSTMVTLVFATCLSFILSMMELFVALRVAKPQSFGVWEVECILSTMLTLLSRLLDIAFCVSLVSERRRPVLTFVAWLIILTSSLIPRSLIGIFMIATLFSDANRTLVQILTGDIHCSSGCSVSEWWRLFGLVARRSPPKKGVSVSVHTHTASLGVSLLWVWSHAVSFAQKMSNEFRAKQTSARNCNWLRSNSNVPINWDTPQLLLAQSDLQTATDDESNGQVELVARSLSAPISQEPTELRTETTPDSSLAKGLKEGLRELHDNFGAGEMKVLQLANTTYLYDHYLLGHLLHQDYIAKDLIEELDFTTSLGIFVWCHLTVLILNLLKFHTLLSSSSSSSVPWLSLVSLLTSLTAACNLFFVHTFDQQLLDDLMDDSSS